MNKYADLRGVLFSIKNIPFEVNEILISKNLPRVLRGLHRSPYRKRVIVLKGKIYDFFWNPETGEKTEITLNEGDYIDVPSGCAHGFYTYEKSNVLYLLEGKYDANIDTTIFWKDSTTGLDLNFPQDSITISNKDSSAFYYNSYDYYVLGAKGYLGANCVSILKKQGCTVYESNLRLNDINSIKDEIMRSRAKYVICAAGISGKPTIEWCETNETETYETNYLGVVDLIRLTKELSLHLTIFGSGLIYSGEKDIYNETDTPNLTSKVYCKWRIQLEQHISLYNHVLYLRIIYPITLDGHPKCFMTKMKSRAQNVHPIKVSITFVPELFCKIKDLCNEKITGIFNFVNTHTILLTDLLGLYSKYSQKIDIIINSASDGKGGYELCNNKLSSVVSVSNIKDILTQYFNNLK